MHLFINNFSIQNLKGVQMNAFMQRKDSVADSGVVSQTQILLRGTRRRGRMTMPVGKNLQSVGSGILQCCELILWSKGKMFGRVIDVLHPVVLCYHIAILRANTQQVAARFVRCVLLGLINQLLNNLSLHEGVHLNSFKILNGEVVDKEVHL